MIDDLSGGEHPTSVGGTPVDAATPHWLIADWRRSLRTIESAPWRSNDLGHSRIAAVCAARRIRRGRGEATARVSATKAVAYRTTSVRPSPSAIAATRSQSGPTSIIRRRSLTWRRSAKLSRRPWRSPMRTDHSRSNVSATPAAVSTMDRSAGGPQRSVEAAGTAEVQRVRDAHRRRPDQRRQRSRTPGPRLPSPPRRWPLRCRHREPRGSRRCVAGRRGGWRRPRRCTDAAQGPGTTVTPTRIPLNMAMRTPRSAATSSTVRAVPTAASYSARVPRRSMDSRRRASSVNATWRSVNAWSTRAPT